MAVPALKGIYGDVRRAANRPDKIIDIFYLLLT